MKKLMSILTVVGIMGGVTTSVEALSLATFHKTATQKMSAAKRWVWNCNGRCTQGKKGFKNAMECLTEKTRHPQCIADIRTQVQHGANKKPFGAGYGKQPGHVQEFIDMLAESRFETLQTQLKKINKVLKSKGSYATGAAKTQKAALETKLIKQNLLREAVTTATIEMPKVESVHAAVVGRVLSVIPGVGAMAMVLQSHDLEQKYDLFFIPFKGNAGSAHRELKVGHNVNVAKLEEIKGMGLDQLKEIVPGHNYHGDSDDEFRNTLHKQIASFGLTWVDVPIVGIL